MENLYQLTAAALVKLHNDRCPAPEHILGPWKKSKRELIERIRAIDASGQSQRSETATEALRPATESAKTADTIGALVAVLLETDLSYTEIVREVKKRFPNARTTTRSVASTAAVLRRRNQSAPRRRHLNPKH